MYGQILKTKTILSVAVLLIITIIFLIHYKFSNELRYDYNSGKSTTLPQYKVENAQVILPEPIRDHKEPIKLKEPFRGAKIIHLDLKGAPPKISYYAELFPYLQRMGATGLLIEYEDMFPYYGELSDLSALNKYSTDDIMAILNLAKNNNLEVIPLIQTFGHMEFIIKQEKYRHLREIDRYPQVICPTNTNSTILINKIIDQILALHPDSKYLHIGSDEVYYIGQCDRCTQFLSDKNWSRQELFLYHVKNTLDYLKKNYPGIVPIMWDDEFRNVDIGLVKEFNINVDIMIWKYTMEIASAITDEIMSKYSQLFSGIWIASGFKGSTGPDSMITNINHHLSNHISWMNLVEQWKHVIKFKGIALTGWQRYDHFSVLCELLPIAIPSLTICLKYLNAEVIDENTMSRALGCDFPFPWIPSETNIIRQNTECAFPGSEIYYLVNSFYIVLQNIEQRDKNVARGWFSWYNIIYKYSNPSHVDQATSFASYNTYQVGYLKEALRTALLKVYDDYTAEEWINTFILPIHVKLKSTLESRDAIMSRNSWPRRPLTLKTKKPLSELCNGSFNLPCALLGS